LLYGERDDVVPVRESADRISAALQQAGNRRFTVKVFPGADHELTIAANRTNIVPGYFELVNQWIKENLYSSSYEHHAYFLLRSLALNGSKLSPPSASSE